MPHDMIVTSSLEKHNSMHWNELIVRRVVDPLIERELCYAEEAVFMADREIVRIVGFVPDYPVEDVFYLLPPLIMAD